MGCSIISGLFFMESTASWHKFTGLLLWSWQQSSVFLIRNKIGCWDSLFPETTIRSAWGCPQQKEPLFWLVIFVSGGGKASKSIEHTNILLCRWSQPTVPVCSLCSKEKLKVEHHIRIWCAQYEIQGQLHSDLLCCWSTILGLQKGYSYVALIYTKFSCPVGVLVVRARW